MDFRITIAKSKKPDEIGSFCDTSYEKFRTKIMKKGKEDLELLQLTNEQKELFVRQLYNLGNHFIDRALEKKII
jgi:hypothetical protein